ncbi:unnamed protein product [Zymoseptoria tritici ST99CH_3D1]|nr:unnamed protein product [Zymoseptoria tritici ST99CH_3D1]
MDITTERMSSAADKQRPGDGGNETRCKKRNDLQPTDRSSPASSPSSFPSSVSDLEMSRYLERCENTVHRPRSEPVTRSNTYRHPIQEDMLQAYNEFGLIDLTTRIMVDKNAPDLKVSRLTAMPREDVMLLLGQLEGDVLQSILCNTFDSEALVAKESGDTWIRHEPAALEIEVNGKIAIAPGIYVNVFAPAAGGGLSRQQLGLFVLALRCLSGDSVPAERLVTNGEDVEHGVKYQIRKMLGRDLNEDDKDEMKNMMRILALGWEDRLRVVSPGIEHFGTCVIGGWAIDLGRRLEQYEQSMDTPLFFTTVRCVLLHLFPELQFTLRQYVILRPFRPDDVSAGESIVHQLFASYLASGGCNETQAGISGDSPERLDPEMCRKIETVAMEHGLTALLKRNMLAERTRIEAYDDACKAARIAEVKKQLHEKIARISSRLDADEKRHFEVDQRLRLATTAAADFAAAATALLKELKRRESRHEESGHE